MNAPPPAVTWNFRALRGRYAPPRFLGHGLVTSAPWVNFALLVVFFLILPMDFIVQPSVVIELPETPFMAGSPFGPTIVVLSLEGTGRDQRKEIAFFDDQPYLMSDPRKLQILQRALEVFFSQHEKKTLTIEADRRVQQGSLIELYTMAMEVGIRQINIATRPETSRGALSP